MMTPLSPPGTSCSSSSSSSSSSSTIRPSENTPLLGSPTAGPQIGYESDGSSLESHTILDEEKWEAEPKSDSSSPRLQILLLCFARVMEPLAFTSIFPYIAEMVQRNGDLQVSNIGFYSGLIESVFSASQGISLLFWSSCANRLGSKRTLVYSLTGMAVGQALFGMSTSLWQMILFRSITGAFSCSNLIIRIMIGEICTGESQARAFSWYSIAANIGIMFGPVIGGGSADPARQYPFVFKGWWFFELYPFALPGLAVAAVSATAAIFSQLFLKETSGMANAADEIDYTGDAEQFYSNVSTWQLLKIREISGAFWSHAHVMVCWTAINAILPVVLYTSIALGGWQLSQRQISIYLSSLGVFDGVWMFLVFPILQRRVGTKGILQTGSIMWPCFTGGFIVVNALLRKDAVIAAIIVGVFMTLVGTAIGMSFTAAQLAINEASPSFELSRKMNFLAELSISIIRSTIPVIISTIFAVGVSQQIFSGYLALLIVTVFASGLPIILTRVKNT